MSDLGTDTVSALEWRITRLESLLQTHDVNGESTVPSNVAEPYPVTTRVAKLENRLSQLCSQSRAAQELLQLHALHPDLFPQQSEVGPDSYTSSANKLSTLLSSETLFPATVSLLNKLQEYTVPDAKALMLLSELRPRLSKARALQEAQARDVAELRHRSAAVLARWYEDAVLQSGEQWTDWARRLAKLEQIVRRKEVARSKADGHALG